MTLAWVGLVNNTESRLDIVASSGKSRDCLHKLDFTLNPNALNQSNPAKPAVKAVLHKKIVIINDYLNHPETHHQYQDARVENIHAVAALPVFRNQQVIGVFSVRILSACWKKWYGILNTLSAIMNYSSTSTLSSS